MNIVVDREKYIDLSTAIQKKNGLPTVEPLSMDEMVSDVKAIETGGAGTVLPESPKDINFYDYDGTLLHAYTFEEAASLVKMPKAPEHEGLTFQCWNEQSLDFIKRVKLPLDIGAVFTTSDNKTHLKIRVLKDNWSLYYNGCAIKGKMFINWGDGGDEQYSCNQFTTVMDGNGNLGLSINHTYAKAGEYDVTVWGEDCDELLVDTYDFNNTNNGYGCILLEVHYSSQVKRIGNYYGNYSVSFLYNSYFLRKVSIPNSVTSLDQPLISGNDYGCQQFIVLPPSLEEILGISSSSSGAPNRFLIPRTVKTYLGPNYFYVNASGVEYWILRYPNMKFVQKENNGRFSNNAGYPNIYAAGNDSNYAETAYLIFGEAEKKVFSQIQPLSYFDHVYIADEIYPQGYEAWQDAVKNNRNSNTAECKRISMKDGARVDDSMAAKMGATTTEKGIAIAKEQKKLTGKTESVDTGLLYVTTVDPSTYDGVILEVGY